MARALLLSVSLMVSAGCISPCTDVGKASDPKRFAEIVKCTEITGDLDLSGIREVVLPNLVRVEGNLNRTGGGLLTQFSAPKLASVGGHFQVHGFGPLPLSTFELPALETVGGMIEIGTANVVSISLPALRTAGAVLISRIDSLESLSLPQLEKIEGSFHVTVDSSLGPYEADGGDFFVYQLPLKHLELPSLVTTGSVKVQLLKSMTTLDAPKLRAVGQMMYLGDCNALTTWAFPSVETVGGTFVVFKNELLTAIDLPKLTNVGGRFDIVQNPSFSKCTAEALVADLMDRGVISEANVHTNREEVCP